MSLRYPDCRFPASFMDAFMFPHRAERNDSQLRFFVRRKQGDRVIRYIIFSLVNDLVIQY